MKDIPASPGTVPIPVVGRSTLADYISLTKPRLNLLVVVTSAAGYYLGAAGPSDLRQMLPTVVGTALVAGGAAVLNQVYERDTDALMVRTRMRALPDGRVPHTEASIFGVGLSAVGLGMLVVWANVVATLLAVATLVVYLAVYTPLKRRTSAATFVGAIPGALPPLIGWAASHGGMSAGGVTLFAIVFLWQIPHFMAIAWMFRDDYAKGGFPMLPVIEPGGRRAGRQAAVYAAILLPVSLLPFYVGISGTVYLYVALVLSLAFVALAVGFARDRTEVSSRRLFFGSIAYLPLLWAAMIADRL